MSPTELTRQLEFVVARRHQDQATVLGQAVQEGIHALYRDALLEAYLLGQIAREIMLNEFGAEQLQELEFQRDVFKRDVTWGMQNV
jgi:hypothetical protein